MPQTDIPVITDMLTQLKNRWNALCGSAVDRQRKLEEALLFSGQFKEALQALLDWLYKIEPTLREDLPLHGDIDTVNSSRKNTELSSKSSAKEQRLLPRYVKLPWN